MSFLVTRITRLRYFVVTALAALVLIASPGGVRVFAWGAVGHRVVARIAWALMTPAARERATALLGGGQDVFVAAATWADEIRSSRPETYNWHFVDIPIDARRYDPARDCRSSDKGDCVIAEIARARAELADASRSDALKAESLKFLIHFVGDLHQPLHAIDNHDRGGNDVKVMALRGEDGRNTNLHSAWDTGLINLSDETEAARAARLVEAVKAHPESTSLDVTSWALESHAIAVADTYHYPGFSSKGPPMDPVTLDESYRAQAMKDIDQQLERGGARLAALLNSLLAPQR